MEQNLEIFSSLFKGRSDVFAIRWEREGKSGYMPAYILDWDEYKIHKSKGGTLKDFTNKQHAPLTNQRILNHLEGKEILGIYPLLQDNTSWFITADFDQSTSKSKLWIDECRAFIQECENHDLPVYLERSRSGTGGHVWMFFEEPYPAFKSRQLFTYFLKSSGIISEGKKTSNFDRLFPNQDNHSGLGLGNLIALPLQKKAVENGNTCFIQPENLVPFPDQWSFLETIQKVTLNKLNELYNDIIVHKQSDSDLKAVAVTSPDSALPIILSNQIVQPRSGLHPALLKYLKDTFNLMNVEYLIKKQTGKNTYGTPMFFKSVEEKENTLVVLKLRFVLQPFSFLFLIAGEKRYHIIWETLDTEDATYIWHAVKTRESLRIKLGEIEIILKNIKLKGRQTFLETEHDNFIRVVHDYSDAKKGFVSWKGVLEEKLI